MTILLLQDDDYVPAPRSRAVPIVAAEALTGLFQTSKGLSQAEWLQLAREWVNRPRP